MCILTSVKDQKNNMQLFSHFLKQTTIISFTLNGYHFRALTNMTPQQNSPINDNLIERIISSVKDINKTVKSRTKNAIIMLKRSS